MRNFFLGARDLELHLANKNATSLQGDGETEHRVTYFVIHCTHKLCVFSHVQKRITRNDT